MRTKKSFKGRKQEKGYQVLIIELMIYVFVIFLFVRVVPTYVLQRTLVDGPSMEDALHNGDSLLIEKISCRFNKLERFDIIAFYPYGKEVDEYYIKRIIGLPEETIQIIDEDIYIDGELLDEDYGKMPITYSGIAKDGIRLEEDEYFVMGDNREASFDSRYKEIGAVKQKDIGGKAIFRIFPLDRIGILD
jgi:signal peptidase I